MKHFVFKYYSGMAILLCIGGIFLGIKYQQDLKWELVATFIGSVISSVFVVQKQRLEELRLFNELYTKFNSRYDARNESLNEIGRGDSQKDLEPGELDTLYNYFNLCGEEYFYYKQGYIYPEVWKAWRNGMKIFYQNEQTMEVSQDYRQKMMKNFLPGCLKFRLRQHLGKVLLQRQLYPRVVRLRLVRN